MKKAKVKKKAMEIAEEKEDIDYLVNGIEEMKIEEEIWKDIDEFDGYMVSNMGNVKSFRQSKDGKLLKQTDDGAGYMTLNITNISGPKVFKVHRLVAQAFLDKSEIDKKLVNHKNGIKNDNRLSNLEWMNHQENTKHAIENELTVHATHKVSQFTINGVFIKNFDSIKQAAEVTNCSRSCISNVCRGITKTTGGFVWKYTDIVNTHVTEPDGIILPEFNGYIITNDGKVYSKRRRIFLLPSIKRGYEKVRLHDKIDMLIHRLVAIAYLPNSDPNKYTIVNHIDFNKRNNHVSNLEWVTLQENSIHAAVKWSKPVCITDLDGNIVKIYGTLTAAEKDTCIDHRRITDFCNNGTVYKNMLWKFMDKK